MMLKGKYDYEKISKNPDIIKVEIEGEVFDSVRCYVRNSLSAIFYVSNIEAEDRKTKCFITDLEEISFSPKDKAIRFKAEKHNLVIARNEANIFFTDVGWKKFIENYIEKINK